MRQWRRWLGGEGDQGRQGGQQGVGAGAQVGPLADPHPPGAGSVGGSLPHVPGQAQHTLWQPGALFGPPPRPPWRGGPGGLGSPLEGQGPQGRQRGVLRRQGRGAAAACGTNRCIWGHGLVLARGRTVCRVCLLRQTHFLYLHPRGCILGCGQFLRSRCTWGGRHLLLLFFLQGQLKLELIRWWGVAWAPRLSLRRW